MYSWYQGAAVCYAYLADIEITPGFPAVPIENSWWFTRGLTLQELPAPHILTFYDKFWQWIGTKAGLADRIRNKTGIPKAILERTRDMQEESVARRMSWAAERSTTRVEDLAYGLLGLFDVNMPLIYGKGKKAFIRLQEEISKGPDDHSIFAWRLSLPNNFNFQDVDYVSGILASEVQQFRGCGLMTALQDPIDPSAPFAMTNMGLSIELPVLTDGGLYTDVYVAMLDCFEDTGARPHSV